MTRSISKIIALTGVAALGLTGVAEAKKHHLDMTGHGSQSGVDLKSTYKGKPFGTCKMTGKLVIPNTQQTWTCGKLGSFKLVGKGATPVTDDTHGTWNIVKGSGKGKLKGITGKGTFTGKLSTGVFRYVGTVNY